MSLEIHFKGIYVDVRHVLLRTTADCTSRIRHVAPHVFVCFGRERCPWEWHERAARVHVPCRWKKERRSSPRGRARRAVGKAWPGRPWRQLSPCRRVHGRSPPKKPSKRKKRGKRRCVLPLPLQRNKKWRRRTQPSVESPGKLCRTLETSSGNRSIRSAKITRPIRIRIKKKVPSRPRASTERWGLRKTTDLHVAVV